MYTVPIRFSLEALFEHDPSLIFTLQGITLFTTTRYTFSKLLFVLQWCVRFAVERHVLHLYLMSNAR